MLAKEVETILQENFPLATIKVAGEGENFSVEVISADFENISKLNRQKKILACVRDHIAAGEIHAFSVQAFTQDEWKRNASLTVL